MTFAPEQYANKAQSTLASPLDSSSTSLTIVSATSFPTQGNFRIRVDTELMLCTSISGTTLTVTRGIEGTIATSHVSGAAVTQSMTAAGYKNNPLGMTAPYDMPYLDASGNQNRLAANTSATMKVIGSQGDGVNPTAPQMIDPQTLITGGIVSSANANRLLTAKGGGLVNADFTTAVQLKAPTNGAATFPSAQLVGNNINVVQGRFRTGEQVNVAKGITLVDYPNWNPPTNTCFNAFGFTLKLQSGICLTIWARQTADAATDGLSVIYGAISVDDGGSWGPPFQIYAASQNPSYNIAVSGGLGQDSKGRIFATMALFGGSNPILSYLVWTDDPTGQTGWTSPDLTHPVCDPNYPTYWLTGDAIHELPDGSGTLITTGYGPENPAQSSVARDVTLIQSTDRGIHWTHRSNIAVHSDSDGNIESTSVFRTWDGKLMVAFLQDATNTIFFALSSDFGATDGGWSLSAGSVPGAARPSIVSTDGGALLVQTRSQTLSTGETTIFTCRDQNGMLSTSWTAIAEQTIDSRHNHNEYGCLVQVRPNVVLCTFGGSVANRSSADWNSVHLADGCAHLPTGTFYGRNIEARMPAFLRQTVQSVPDPIQKIASPVTATDIAVNAILDLLTTEGLNLQHPADGGKLAGSWRSWKVPSNINDWNDTFVGSDNASVVTNAFRGVASGISIAPTYPKGTWGIQSNQMYLSAPTGGAGYNPHVMFAFGKGDGTATLPCASFAAAYCIVLRWVDANNFLMGYIDGINVRIYKIAAGVATQLSTAALAIGAVPVSLQVTASGNLIQVFVNVNNAGFPTNPQTSFTLSGADATTYSNANTSWGVLEFATSSNRFTSFTFTTGPIVIGTTANTGENFYEIPELGGGIGAGSLVQATFANTGTLQQNDLMAKGKLSWVRLTTFNGSNKVSYKTLTNFSPTLAGPYTVFITCSIPQDTGGTRGLFLISDGASFSGAMSISTGRTIAIGGQSGHFFSVAGAFPAYPYGRPVIFRCVFNKTSSELWADGQPLAQGKDTGTSTGLISIQLGDAINQSIMNVFDLTVYYGGLLTTKQIHEVERGIAATLDAEGWSDR